MYPYRVGDLTAFFILPCREAPLIKCNVSVSKSVKVQCLSALLPLPISFFFLAGYCLSLPPPSCFLCLGPSEQLQQDYVLLGLERYVRWIYM